MFDKNRVQFMNAYYKETEKPFGYLLVDNKPDTAADKQVLGDIFGDCHVYVFATQNKVSNISVESTPVETRLRKKQPCHSCITWSDATIGRTTPGKRRWSVTFPKDMLSWRCISHRAIVLSLAIQASTSAEKITGLSK